MAPRVAGLPGGDPAPPSSRRSASSCAQPRRLEISIRGRVYDITDFADRHPGGAIIRSKVNPASLPWPADVTGSFEGLHARSKAPYAVLASLEKEGRCREWSAQERAAYEAQAPCGAALEQKYLSVTARLRSLGMFKPAPGHVALRILEMLALIALGLWLIPRSFLLGTMVYGLSLSRGGWVMHEAHHGSLTCRPAADRWIARVVMGVLCGGSSEWWRRAHNRHHATTNQHGMDPDMNTAPLSAFDTRTALKVPVDASPLARAWMRIQHLVWPATSGLGIVYWINWQHPSFAWQRGHWRDVLFLVLFRAIFVWAMPADVSWGYTAAAFVMSTWWTGVFLLCNFAISHTPMPTLGKEDRDDSWVSSAFEHTMDVHSHPGPWGGVVDRAVTWIMGYLNYQVAHHLWPTMPQVHQADPRVHAALRELVAADPRGRLRYHVTTYWHGLSCVSQNLYRVARQRIDDAAAGKKATVILPDVSPVAG